MAGHVVPGTGTAVDGDKHISTKTYGSSNEDIHIQISFEVQQVLLNLKRIVGLDF